MFIKKEHRYSLPTSKKMCSSNSTIIDLLGLFFFFRNYLIGI
nr:MAG TPA: hypothetical protein [Caudoviricetes sp.]